MNFLQLCQRVALESGTVAGLPSFNTVANASGRLAKIVAWTSDAWVEIQNSRVDWRFRVNEFSHALTIGQNRYTGSGDLGITDFGRFLPDNSERLTMSLYDPAIGVADEGAIEQKGFDEWRRCYFIGDQSSHSRPVIWAEAPNGDLCVGAAPDLAYVIRGQYQRKAQVLSLDADTPIVSDQFHNVIVRQALINMDSSDEEFQGLAARAGKYDQVNAAFVIDQTPQAQFF